MRARVRICAYIHMNCIRDTRAICSGICGRFSVCTYRRACAIVFLHQTPLIIKLHVKTLSAAIPSLSPKAKRHRVKPVPLLANEALPEKLVQTKVVEKAIYHEAARVAASDKPDDVGNAMFERGACVAASAAPDAGSLDGVPAQSTESTHGPRPDWLPHGWVIGKHPKLTDRLGHARKCFIHVATNRVDTNKREVLKWEARIACNP